MCANLEKPRDLLGEDALCGLLARKAPFHGDWPSQPQLLEPEHLGFSEAPSLMADSPRLSRGATANLLLVHLAFP